MTNRWIDELSVTALEAIYEDIVFEANLDEHLAILFGVLQNFLEKAWLGGVSGNAQMEKSAVLGAIEVIGFLRSHLNPVSDHAANGVLRRFYNGAHRQIITAHRDGNFAELRVVRAQIKKLVELQGVLSKLPAGNRHRSQRTGSVFVLCARARCAALS